MEYVLALLIVETEYEVCAVVGVSMCAPVGVRGHQRSATQGHREQSPGQGFKGGLTLVNVDVMISAGCGGCCLASEEALLDYRVD